MRDTGGIGGIETVQVDREVERRRKLQTPDPPEIAGRMHLDAVLPGDRLLLRRRASYPDLHQPVDQTLLEDPRHRARMRISVALVLRIHVRVGVKVKNAEAPPALRHGAYCRVADGVIAAEHQQPWRDGRGSRHTLLDRVDRRAHAGALRYLEIAMIDHRVGGPDAHAPLAVLIARLRTQRLADRRGRARGTAAKARVRIERDAEHPDGPLRLHALPVGAAAASPRSRRQT